jgi:hypothetical protein
MITKYRIIHASGWVEFTDPNEAATYRDTHHPGCPIETITEEPPAE